MKCIVWLADAGVENFLINSIGSLRLNGRAFWEEHPKLVLDFGLSKSVSSFLASIKDEGVFVHRMSLPEERDVVGSNVRSGVGVMRRRVELSGFIDPLVQNLGLIVQGFIVCDADTVFLQPPNEFPLPTKPLQICIMREWDVIDNIEIDMLLYRPSSFVGSVLPEDSVSTIATHLRLSEDQLRKLPTYNTGVFSFCAGANLKQAWEAEYKLLQSLRDEDDMLVFSPYAAEQNALSLSIFKGQVLISELPRRFNQFPPRSPRGWDVDTVIAHFITFRRNHTEPRYRLWFKTREQVFDNGFIPEALLF
jgi:hypothetical protein